MNTSLLIPALTTAVSVGLGCGTCCSPIISTFLSAYVVSHSDGVKKRGSVICQFLFWQDGQCFPALYACRIA